MVPIGLTPLTAPGKATDAETAATIGSIILALMLPLLLNTLLNEWQGKASDWLGRAWKKLGDMLDGERVVRALEYVETFDKYGWAIRTETGDDDRNQILIKAIQLHMSKEMSALKHPIAHTCLVEDTKAVAEDGESDSDDSDSGDEAYSAARELQKLVVRTVPPPEVWTTARERSSKGPKVEILFSRSTKRRTEKEGAKAGRSTVTSMVELASRGPQADAAIASFVDDAFRAHVARLRATEDTARYMFSPIPKSEASWKRYRLSEEKSFETLFFAAKTKLLAALDDFTNKRGNYAIEGFPYKLGLLLHGPPGTGKTSLIKALAERTKRHIVNLPLSRVKTNQQLTDMMFDGRFAVTDLDEAVNLKLDECIFVMEDVDACSSVVLARAPAPKPDGEEGEAAAAATEEEKVKEEDPNPLGLAAPPPRHKAGGLPGSPRAGSSPRAAAAADTADTSDVTAPTLTRSGSCMTDPQPPDNEAAAAEDAPPTQTSAAGWGASATAGDDTLDLAGLLNALDGIVDSPGRIVVMTSNHPEKLDPALIRPGRINLKLHLGYIDRDSAMEMCNHYFEGCPQHALAQVGDALQGLHDRGRRFTPAQVEHLCAEYETLEELASALMAEIPR